MPALLLLCSLLLTAEEVPQAQARIVQGSEPRNERVADLEPWITRSVAKQGFPMSLPLSEWIRLGADSKPVFQQEQGGVILEGQALNDIGMFQIILKGKGPQPFQQGVQLRPGDRRVILITGIPDRKNLFVALEAPLQKKSLKRLQVLQKEVNSLSISLQYHGPQDKPFYQIQLTTGPLTREESNPFQLMVQLQKAQALQILDHLAHDGFLYQAREDSRTPESDTSGYTLRVSAGKLDLTEELGWGLSMVSRIEALRELLPEAGAKDLNVLLSRLTGLRKQWEAEDLQRTSMKGWEVYIWKENDVMYFALMTGTNRLKSPAEIAASAVIGFEALKPQLERLKQGQSVFLSGRQLSGAPAEEGARQLREYCRKLGLECR